MDVGLAALFLSTFCGMALNTPLYLGSQRQPNRIPARQH
jgi:hypothetical protein